MQCCLYGYVIETSLFKRDRHALFKKRLLSINGDSNVDRLLSSLIKDVTTNISL